MTNKCSTALLMMDICDMLFLPLCYISAQLLLFSAVSVCFFVCQHDNPEPLDISLNYCRFLSVNVIALSYNKTEKTLSK